MTNAESPIRLTWPQLLPEIDQDLRFLRRMVTERGIPEAPTAEWDTTCEALIARLGREVPADEQPVVMDLWLRLLGNRLDIAVRPSWWSRVVLVRPDGEAVTAPARFGPRPPMRRLLTDAYGPYPVRVLLTGGFAMTMFVIVAGAIGATWGLLLAAGVAGAAVAASALTVSHDDQRARDGAPDLALPHGGDPAVWARWRAARARLVHLRSACAEYETGLHYRLARRVLSPVEDARGRRFYEALAAADELDTGLPVPAAGVSVEGFEQAVTQAVLAWREVAAAMDAIADGHPDPATAALPAAGPVKPGWEFLHLHAYPAGSGQVTAQRPTGPTPAE